MAGQQRKCANCRFFNDAGMPGNGWCTHPKRQLNSEVKLLVRAGELACRNSWGGDLFQSRLDAENAPTAAADLPGDDKDDEVTSVSIPSNQPIPAEDRVVRDRPAARHSQPLDSNDAAHRDQEERARLMARGSRDALAHARQRFSSRHQSQNHDVVADDDIDDPGGRDRVVTRQQRFSDREVTPGLPPLRTAPVPRAEVHQRGIASEDRFETVPSIDPDFDMPGQRHRLEPAADAAPPPETPAEAAPLPEPEVDQEQVTTYEHVLQRARRIRETKQDRARPIRRADILPVRDDAAPDLSEPWQGADHAPKPRERHDAFAEPTMPEYVADPVRDEPAWIDANDSLETWDGEDEDDAWEDDPVAWDDADHAGTTSASWADEDDDWEEDDPAAWDDADVVYEPEPRRSGWLSRFGFGRRTAEPVHDDAMITRHANSVDEWLDDEPYEFDDEPFEDDLDTDRSNRTQDPYQWDHDRDREAQEFARGQVFDDSEPAPAWPEVEIPTPAPELPGYDDLPPWRDTRSSGVYADELPSPAPVPPPVPASERVGDEWNVSGMPVRPASVPRTRARLTAELPDLDDALFDDARGLRAESQVVTRGEAEHSRLPGTASPRDSFFRSSRYPEQELASSFRDTPDPEILDPGSPLPDIEGDRLDVRGVVERGNGLVDRRIEVAPEIPRTCRTCRSFRSADGGTRGWCTSEWAFTHRRMVNEDDLACVSAIGCWWMPADHLRLDLDEEPGNVRTPRMDELIARNRPAARKASGE